MLGDKVRRKEERATCCKSMQFETDNSQMKKSRIMDKPESRFFGLREKGSRRGKVEQKQECRGWLSEVCEDA
jgi:hypothetical protein